MKYIKEFEIQNALFNMYKCLIINNYALKSSFIKVQLSNPERLINLLYGVFAATKKFIKEIKSNYKTHVKSKQ